MLEEVLLCAVAAAEGAQGGAAGRGRDRVVTDILDDEARQLGLLQAAMEVVCAATGVGMGVGGLPATAAAFADRVDHAVDLWEGLADVAEHWDEDSDHRERHALGLMRSCNACWLSVLPSPSCTLWYVFAGDVHFLMLAMRTPLSAAMPAELVARVVGVQERIVEELGFATGSQVFAALGAPPEAQSRVYEHRRARKQVTGCCMVRLGLRQGCFCMRMPTRACPHAHAFDASFKSAGYVYQVHLESCADREVHHGRGAADAVPRSSRVLQAADPQAGAAAHAGLCRQDMQGAGQPCLCWANIQP